MYCVHFSIYLCLQIVDGWEMNGDVFPGVYDHAKTRDERFHHFCGGKSSIGSSSSVLASQNAALVMYRVPPIPGAGFSIRVRHIKSHTREFRNFLFLLQNLMFSRYSTMNSNISAFQFFHSKLNIPNEIHSFRNQIYL